MHNRAGVAARIAAGSAVRAVLTRGEPLGRPPGHLSTSDRAFADLLAKTTLRRAGQIDELLVHAAGRPLGKIREPVRSILRVCAAHLVFLDAPPHTISTAVNAIRAVRPGAKAFANAVLRAAVRDAPIILSQQEAPRLNTPDSLWQSWQRDYGDDGATAIAQAHLIIPPLDVTCRDPAQAEQWAMRLEGIALPGGGVRIPQPPGDITKLAGFAEGAWWVQDCAARLATTAMTITPRMHVLDLCAAPGGKTAQLIAMGASVTARESDSERAQRLTENLARLSMEATIEVCDARKAGGQFDGVLADLPCSASGTIRRHPDVAYRRRDPETLRALQDALLAQAAHCVRPGGQLVMVTCSLAPEEGSGLAARFLTHHPSFTLTPLTPPWGLTQAAREAGFLQTLPYYWLDRGGMDGFFIARFLRTDNP
ncbi:MAG: transcription antitermination factor NusB [Pseudomonadota bacterium]